MTGQEIRRLFAGVRVRVTKKRMGDVNAEGRGVWSRVKTAQKRGTESKDGQETGRALDKGRGICNKQLETIRPERKLFDGGRW